MSGLLPIARAALLACCAACGGGEAGIELPEGVAGLPGRTCVLLHGPLAQRALAEGRGLLESSVQGLAHAVAGSVAASWADLGASRSFRAAFAARPGLCDAAGASWVYVDLQLLLDELLARSGEVRGPLPVAALVEPLGLRSFDWLIAGLRDGRGEVGEAVLRAREADGGLAAVLAGRPGPSLLGDPGPGERLRLELRLDAAAARRALDAWLVTEDQAGLSARNALAALAARSGRELLGLVDGRISAVVDAGGEVALAVGLTEPDDARDLLDRFFKSDGPDLWLGPDDRPLRVAGRRLVAGGPAELPAEGRAPVEAVLTVDAAATAALVPDWIVGAPGRLRLELRRTDADTLRAVLRATD